MPAHCITYGVPDEDGTRFSRPLPAVGLYVAGASFLCFLGLFADLCRSLRRGKLWVASSSFPLNAATLTLLAIATKLSSDLTTAMPGAFDQLAKLSSMALLCVVMNHFMLSLGSMSRGAVASNVVALGILVVTVSVNVWIQIYTGVLAPYTALSVVFTVGMMYMFFFFVSHALAAPIIMGDLEDKYSSKHRKIASEMPDGLFSHGVITTERLLGYVDKYWLMALTSSPDYAMHRLTTSLVSSIYCFEIVVVTSIASIVVLLRNSAGYGGGGRPCRVVSAYHWSIPLVLVAQAMAISVGTVVSILRFKNTGFPESYSSVLPDEGTPVCETPKAILENHWVQVLREWWETPLSLEHRGEWVRRFVNFLKEGLLQFSSILHASILLPARLSLFLTAWMFKKCFKILKDLDAAYWSASSVHVEESQPPDELNEYVLQFDDHEWDVPPTQVVKQWWKNPREWTDRGRGNQPKHLLMFLKQHPEPEDSTNSTAPKLMPEELPHCWALRMATLAAITSALTKKQRGRSEQLVISAVREGLRYARFVEKNLEATHSRSTRVAADMVWERVDLYHRWLDKVNLDELATGGEDRAVKKLRDRSGQYSWGDLADTSPLKWPPRMLAAYCMNKAAGSILPDIEEGASCELVLARLEGALAVVLRDCLRHLPRAIVGECHRRRFGDREEGVLEAALVLGEAEQVLDYLGILRASHETSSIYI